MKFNIGTWTFRAITIGTPALAVLSVELAQHAIDLWALGVAVIGCVISAAANANRASQTTP